MEIINNKVYEFRKLGARDIFPMVKILKAIGVNKFAQCFENENVKKALASFQEGNESNEMVGTAVMLEIAQVIMEGLDKCEEDIFKLLASVSNLTEEEIKNLDIATFAEMIIDFIKKDDFKDFIQAVSKSFK